MIPLPYLSVLEFKGNDASQFLQNQLSADIAAIPSGEAGFACCCNPSGRVLALMLVRPGAGSCLAICAGGLADLLTHWLGKFIFRADVSISRRQDLVVAGQANTENGECRFRTVTGMNYTTVDADSPHPAASGTGPQDWKAMELQTGIAWLDPDTSGRFLPQMLGCESIGALSFSKGCYPGQEIIARTRYLGKLKRHPVRCRVDGALSLEQMDEITLAGAEGQAKAVVVDHARLDDGSTQIFAVARMDADFSPATIVWNDREFAAGFVT